VVYFQIPAFIPKALVRDLRMSMLEETKFNTKGNAKSYFHIFLDDQTKNALTNMDPFIGRIIHREASPS